MKKENQSQRADLIKVKFIIGNINSTFLDTDEVDKPESVSSQEITEEQVIGSRKESIGVLDIKNNPPSRKPTPEVLTIS